MFSSNFLFFQSHADIEVVSLVLFFDQSHPFIYLLFLQFYLADVGLIPVQSMHRQAQHQHQHTQSDPDLGIPGLSETRKEFWFLKLHLHIFFLVAADVLYPTLFLFCSFCSDKDVGREGPLAPSTVLLTPEQFIFLTKMVYLLLHDFRMNPLPISIILGIVFVAFPLLVLRLLGKKTIIIQLLLEQMIKEVILRDLGMCLHVFVCHAGHFVQPVWLNKLLETQLICHCG